MAYYNPITTVASVGTQTQPIPVTIASANEPTTRENGGTLRQGDNWYDTENGSDYIWIVNQTTQEGSWKIIGSGASGGAGGAFVGGFVPNTILVGGSEDNPNLTLSSAGGIVAEQTIEIRTPTDNGVSFIVKDRDESTGLRILGDGTLQTGMKTGDNATAPDVGIQLNPDGTIEMGGSKLRVADEVLFINDIAIIEAPQLNTANLLLVNPTALKTTALSKFNISSLAALPPLTGLVTQQDFNEWGYATSTYLDETKIDDAPVDGSTYGRNNNAWVPVNGITVKGTVPTVADLASVPNPANGDLYVVAADGHGYVYESGTWEDIGPIQGPPGPAGPSGNAATVSVGSTTTGEAGTNAAVVNTGTVSNAIFDFTIPQGAVGKAGPQGDPGTAGETGEAATATAGATFTGDPGTDAIVTNVSLDPSNAVFNFTVPSGLTGVTGDAGPQGESW